jgi:hypothetical protein
MQRIIRSACVSGVLVGAIIGQSPLEIHGAIAGGEIRITISPTTIVLGCEKGDRVTVHADIPLALVDRSSLALKGVAPLLVKDDHRGNLVAKFDQAAIEDLVQPPQATLTLTGVTIEGVPFSGSDAVRVIADPSPDEDGRSQPGFGVRDARR